MRTLLVANRGEIAWRIIRTAREMGIRTVAVFSDPDAGAPHTLAADVAVPLGGATPVESYLSVDKLLAAAKRSGADAVHPGYGFLSENASFAEACATAGLVFVGPSPEAIREMGVKHRAKDLAQRAGVPVLPSSVLTTDEAADWAAAASDVGFPLLVKASAGGGGRGMRLVPSVDELSDAVVAARREAASAFGDPTVFLERFLPSPRHVEVQVFGDSHGNVVHLLERECSIQRRHQKVVEEAPSPAVTPELRAVMGSTACALAAALGYVGAGTVEFLLDGEDFYFLEMNTRLQVEHPVTEAVTGLDLVRLQLEVARGEPLRIGNVEPQGWAIEVRLYAEDPAAGFAPTFGTLHRYEHAGVPGVRYDDGVASGSEVSTFYDPMLAKVVAHAASRDEAASRLALALGEMELHGPQTNRGFLVRVLTDDDFLAGRTTTDFIEQHSVLLEQPPAPVVHLAAAIATTARRRRAAAPVAGLAPSGWRLFPSGGQRGVWEGPDGTTAEVEYELAGLMRLVVDGTPHELGVSSLDVDGVHLTTDGLTTVCRVHHAPDGRVWVNDRAAQSRWRELPRFPEPLSAAAARGPVSEVPGTVVSVHVSPGQSVAAGELLVVLEAMKMEHRVTAPRDAVVASVPVSAGDFVDVHAVLVVLED